MTNVPPPPPPPPPPGPPPPPPPGPPGPPPPGYGPSAAWGGGQQSIPNAGRMLATAIVGLFCCGIVLGPIAAVQAKKAMNQADATPGAVFTNRGTVQAAFIIGIVAGVLSLLGIILLAAGGSP